MILLNNVSCSLDTDFSKLLTLAARALRISEKEIESVSLFRKSVDARKKDNVHFCCSFLVKALNEERIIKRNKNAKPYKPQRYTFPTLENPTAERPVIIGFGPAGIFAALTLAKAGARPMVFERGSDVETRTAAVEEFFKTGVLNCENNVQFGEGGAGTFSDGKLTTGITDIRCREVLKEFVSCGAQEEILTDAKPHIGTDVLKTVVKNLREKIIRLGGEVNFNSKIDDIEIKNGKITAVFAKGKRIPCSQVILATGHSARDTFFMLKERGAEMVRKPFSAGVRIEHLQTDINTALYGDFASHTALGAADYKLSTHLENGRGVYTFCMCPGGEVINSSSEADGVAVNGMSYSARNGANSNSAVIVSVNPEDIPGNDVLAGCLWQREIEQAAFKVSGGSVPAQTVGSFVFGKENCLGKVKPTVKPEIKLCNLEKILPSFICESIKEGIKIFDKKIKGFADCDALLTAPETRSSSPVRIVRNENLESASVCGLYPCGEGAGYAGGIMSAAVDGIKCAEAVISHLNTEFSL